MWSTKRICALAGLYLLHSVSAIEVDWDSPESIRQAASTMVYDMMTEYKGNLSIDGVPPGEFPPPYYWWQSGAAWGSMINYWHFTGDGSYNEIVKQGILYQVGQYNNFIPRAHKQYIGNDDQGFWAITAMQAAEYNFPNPAADQPSWLALVQAVFNEQIRRWDTGTCGGGLRWQMFEKPGYGYKNSVSNGLLFQIAARLARYTGDQMYADWAIKVWDWMWAVNLIDHETYSIYDGSDADTYNCTKLDHNQWTYNPAILLYGTAIMFNFTDGSPLWQNRTSRLLRRIEEVNFPDSIMREGCEVRRENQKGCNEDQKSFKAYLARFMAQASQLAPFAFDQIHRLLGVSAEMAAKQCIGGESGTKCGIVWWRNGTWDGETGLGEQMSALEVTLSVLVSFDDPNPEPGPDGEGRNRPTIGIRPPVTNATGGTSVGDPDAGHDPNELDEALFVSGPKMKDKVGAGILTALSIIGILAGSLFTLTTMFEKRGKTKPTVGGVEKGNAAPVRQSAVLPSGVLSSMATVEEEVKDEPIYKGGKMVT